jgi:hypothetical protein
MHLQVVLKLKRRTKPQNEAQNAAGFRVDQVAKFLKSLVGAPGLEPGTR